MSVSGIENKIVMIGDTNVGKTSIVAQYSNHSFSSSEQKTVGSYFVSQVVRVENTDVLIHIWDTAGEEKFNCLVPMYCRGATAAILVFNANEENGHETIQRWYSDFESSRINKCNVYLVANKIDLEIKADLQFAENWAAENNVRFFKISAKDHDAVQKVFMTVAEDLLRERSIDASITNQELERENKCKC